MPFLMLRWRGPPLPLLGVLSSLKPKPKSCFFSCQSSVSSCLRPIHLIPRSLDSNSQLSPAIRSCCLCRMTIPNCFSAAAADPVPVPSPPEQKVSVSEPDMQALVVVSFYKFADFPDHADLRAPLKALCEELVNLSALFTAFFYFRTGTDPEDRTLYESNINNEEIRSETLQEKT